VHTLYHFICCKYLTSTFISYFLIHSRPLIASNICAAQRTRILMLVKSAKVHERQENELINCMLLNALKRLIKMYVHQKFIIECLNFFPQWINSNKLTPTTLFALVLVRSLVLSLSVDHKRKKFNFHLNGKIPLLVESVLLTSQCIFMNSIKLNHFITHTRVSTHFSPQQQQQQQHEVSSTITLWFHGKAILSQLFVHPLLSFEIESLK
jgi:hypothetical protein